MDLREYTELVQKKSFLDEVVEILQGIQVEKDADVIPTIQDAFNKRFGMTIERGGFKVTIKIIAS